MAPPTPPPPTPLVPPPLREFARITPIFTAQNAQPGTLRFDNAPISRKRRAPSPSSSSSSFETKRTSHKADRGKRTKTGNLALQEYLRGLAQTGKSIARTRVWAGQESVLDADEEWETETDDDDEEIHGPADADTDDDEEEEEEASLPDTDSDTCTHNPPTPWSTLHVHHLASQIFHGQFHITWLDRFWHDGDELVPASLLHQVLSRAWTMFQTPELYARGPRPMLDYADLDDESCADDASFTQSDFRAAQKVEGQRSICSEDEGSGADLEAEARDLECDEWLRERVREDLICPDQNVLQGHALPTRLQQQRAGLLCDKWFEALDKAEYSPPVVGAGGVSALEAAIEGDEFIVMGAWP